MVHKWCRDLIWEGESTFGFLITSWELDSIILAGPFQLKTGYEVISRLSNVRRESSESFPMIIVANKSSWYLCLAFLSYFIHKSQTVLFHDMP